MAAGSLEENWISSSLPYQSREDSMALGERPRCLKSLGGIKMKWERPRGGVYPLGVGCRLGHYQRNWGAERQLDKGEELGHDVPLLV